MTLSLVGLVFVQGLVLLWLVDSALLAACAYGAVVTGVAGWLGWRGVQLRERLVETIRALRETQRAAGMVSRAEMEQRVRDGGGVWFPEDYR